MTTEPDYEVKIRQLTLAERNPANGTETNRKVFRAIIQHLPTHTFTATEGSGIEMVEKRATERITIHKNKLTKFALTL